MKFDQNGQNVEFTPKQTHLRKSDKNTVLKETATDKCEPSLTLVLAGSLVKLEGTRKLLEGNNVNMIGKTPRIPRSALRSQATDGMITI